MIPRSVIVALVALAFLVTALEVSLHLLDRGSSSVAPSASVSAVEPDVPSAFEIDALPPTVSAAITR